MAHSSWNEVLVAKEENRHEIVLSGPGISDRIQQSGIDPTLFTLTDLNFLNISDTCLETIPDDVSKLTNLSNLVLHSNKIKNLTSSISSLSKLKNVDVSRNCLTEFPTGVRELTQLYSLNVSFNNLTTFPSLVCNTRLAILDLSNNAFIDFPDICHAELVHLAEVKLNSNCITVIPHSVSVLPALKLLDVSSNKITEVPGELSDISKLKELNLKDNPLSDKRLAKLVIQCHPKQVLDYIRQHGKRLAGKSGTVDSGKRSKKGRNKSSGSESVQPDTVPDPSVEIEDVRCKLEVLRMSESTHEVQVDSLVKSVRPHIVCCIVRGLNFTPETFQKFIKTQTKLHEGLCNKRQAATLATHDLSALAPGPLKYVAKPPDQVMLQPLGSTKNTPASLVFSRLQSHAHFMMMDRKRNKYSGIHKFLYLLEGKPLYPFLLDSSERVVSFPPLTNSNLTKMSEKSKAMFVEVSSSSSQAICRKVLDALLLECIRIGIGGANVPVSTSDSSDGVPANPTATMLTVEQVRVVDGEGVLQIVYPSRNDLVFDEAEKISVIRNYN